MRERSREREKKGKKLIVLCAFALVCFASFSLLPSPSFSLSLSLLPLLVECRNRSSLSASCLFRIRDGFPADGKRSQKNSERKAIGKVSSETSHFFPHLLPFSPPRQGRSRRSLVRSRRGRPSPTLGEQRSHRCCHRRGSCASSGTSRTFFIASKIAVSLQFSLACSQQQQTPTKTREQQESSRESACCRERSLHSSKRARLRERRRKTKREGEEERVFLLLLLCVVWFNFEEWFHETILQFSFPESHLFP